MIVTKAHVKESERRKAQGEGFKTEDSELAVQTGKDLLIIDSLKPAGKKEMTADEFIRGYGSKL